MNIAFAAWLMEPYFAMATMYLMLFASKPASYWFS